MGGTDVVNKDNNSSEDKKHDEDILLHGDERVCVASCVNTKFHPVMKSATLNLAPTTFFHLMITQILAAKDNHFFLWKTQGANLLDRYSN